MGARDGRWLEAAGVVLVRQRPGSAKGVLFVTLEDETGIANLVIWAKVFEANRRAILSTSMMGVRGRIQRGRGDQARHGGGPDPREQPPKSSRAREVVDPYAHIHEIRVRPRDFR